MRYTINQLERDIDAIMERLKVIRHKKGQDYSGLSTDTLANLRNDGTRGVLCRINDKVCRLRNVLASGCAVEDERVTDTMDDLINYALYLPIMHQQEEGTTQEEAVVELDGKLTIYLAHAVRGNAGDNADPHDIHQNLLDGRAAAAYLRHVLPEAEVYCPADHEDVIGASYHSCMTDRTPIVKKIMAFSVHVVRLCDVFVYITDPAESNGVTTELLAAQESGKICIPLWDLHMNDWPDALAKELNA